MTSETTVSLKAQYMQDKRLYDSLSQAIRLAKAYECTDKKLKPLMMLRQQYKKVQSNNMSKVLRSMPLSSNVCQLENNWHAIRYVNNKGETLLRVDIIKTDEVYLLQRDGRHEPELTREAFDTLLPALLDEEGLEAYKAQLQVSARGLVNEHIGITIEGDEDSVDEPIEEVIEQPSDTDELCVDELPVNVSTHAGLRWVQRVIGIKNDVQAEEHRRKHLNDVNDAVLDAYGLADKVWEDGDGVSYWFDKSNVMFVVGTQNGYPNIVTLYEEDFGFTKEINRMIALKQLEVLADVKEELTFYNQDADSTIAQVEYGVQGINDNIKALESQIALLVSNRAVLTAKREQALKSVKATKDRYVAEFNKLFKKWDA